MSKRDTVADVVHEFSTVSDFLVALTGDRMPCEVLLAPVFRPRHSGTGTTRIQAGVMLNGQRPGYQRIFSCIALAAEAILVGERSVRFTFPSSGGRVQTRQRVQDLQVELLTALSTYLKTDTRVLRVSQPESLWIPTTVHWNPNALLASPLAYQDGHWKMTCLDAPEEPS